MEKTINFQTVAVELQKIFKTSGNVVISGKECTPLCGQVSRTGGNLERVLLAGQVLPAMSGNERLSPLHTVLALVSKSESAFKARTAASYAHINQGHSLCANDLAKLGKSCREHWKYLGGMTAPKFDFNKRFLSVYGDTEKNRKNLAKINSLFRNSLPEFNHHLQVINLQCKEGKKFNFTLPELQKTIKFPEVFDRETGIEAVKPAIAK